LTGNIEVENVDIACQGQVMLQQPLDDRGRFIEFWLIFPLPRKIGAVEIGCADGQSE